MNQTTRRARGTVRRILAMLLSLCLMCPSLPPAFAAGEGTDYGDSNVYESKMKGNLAAIQERAQPLRLERPATTQINGARPTTASPPQRRQPIASPSPVRASCPTKSMR